VQRTSVELPGDPAALRVDFGIGVILPNEERGDLEPDFGLVLEVDEGIGERPSNARRRCGSRNLR